MLGHSEANSKATSESGGLRVGWKQPHHDCPTSVCNDDEPSADGHSLNSELASITPSLPSTALGTMSSSYIHMIGKLDRTQREGQKNVTRKES